MLTGGQIPLDDDYWVCLPPTPAQFHKLIATVNIGIQLDAHMAAEASMREHDFDKDASFRGIVPPIPVLKLNNTSINQRPRGKTLTSCGFTATALCSTDSSHPRTSPRAISHSTFSTTAASAPTSTSHSHSPRAISHSTFWTTRTASSPSTTSPRAITNLPSSPRQRTNIVPSDHFSQRLPDARRRQTAAASRSQRSLPRLPPRRNTAMAAVRRSSTAAVPGRRSITLDTSAILRLTTTYARKSTDTNAFRIPTLQNHYYSSATAPPLYLFRAPGVQLRIGLHSESYLPGSTISGTVLIYRDGTTVSTVRDVNVYLIPEIARRKSNNAYDPSQEFRPQNLNNINNNRYKYTHTLIPAAQKSWNAGPHEARFHSTTHPIRPVIHADIPTFSNGDEVTSSLNHQFSISIPTDAPASRTWKEASKRDAAVDLRYRLVAVVNLSQTESDCTLMAETVVLVANGNINGSRNLGSRAISEIGSPSSSTSSYTSRSSSTFSSLYSYRKPMKKKRSCSKQQQLNLSSQELTLDEKIFVQCSTPPSHNTDLILTELVTYMGKIRAERQITGVKSSGEPGTYWFAADGVGVSLKEGPLSVSHYINAQRVYIYPSRILINSGDNYVSSSSFKYLVRNTHQLRKQPSIRFYYRDELPLFSNLDYTNRNPFGNDSVIPSQRLSALTLASRLPRLTNTNGNAGTECENEVCCLCLDDLHNQKVTRLRPCGHILHLSCTQLWLRHAAAERRGAICCPMCKTVLR